MSDEFSYQLVWSQAAQQALLQLRSKANESGERSQLEALVKSLNALLRRTPLALGTIYRSQGSVDEHRFAKGILGIDFAVDVQRQIVLVRDCELVSADDRKGGNAVG
jgi:hypothetical protein